MRKKIVVLCLMIAMPCMIAGCRKNTDIVTETASTDLTEVEESANQESTTSQHTKEDKAPDTKIENLDEILKTTNVAAIYNANKVRDILSTEQKISSTTDCYNSNDLHRYSYTTETSVENGVISSRTKMVIGDEKNDITYYELTNRNHMPMLYCSCADYNYTEILSSKQFESVLQGNFVENESNISDKETQEQDGAILVDSEIPSDYGKTEILYYASPQTLQLLAVNYSFYDTDDDYTGYTVTNYSYGKDASSDLSSVFPALSEANTFTLHVTYEPGTEDEETINYKLPMGTELKVYDALTNLVYTDADCTNQISIEDIDTKQTQFSIFVKTTD